MKTLINRARFYVEKMPPKAERTTWHIKAEPLPGKDPQAKQSRLGSPKGTTLTPAEQPPVVEEPEARRIAGELLKLQKDGAIAGSNDSDARFYATLLHTFGGTYRP